MQDLLADGLVIADGAMGTWLHGRGIPFGHPYDLANLTHAALVEEAHAAYVDSGARLIETNTFGANRLKLEAHDLVGRLAEINAAGVRLARAAGAGRALVAGAMGPVGKPLQPLGRVSPEEAAAVWREQAEILVAEGVDLILLETFTDLDELRLAVEVVRSVSRVPIIAQKTFIEDGEVLAEGLPLRAAQQLAALDVAALGANCTTGPQRMADIIRAMAGQPGVTLSAMPTAGIPQLVEGAVHYDAPPEYFAQAGRELAEAGARIIGGCCGTTPAHIRALAEALRGWKPATTGGSRPAHRTTVPAQPDAATVALPPKAAVPAGSRSEFARKLEAREFLVTVELDIPRGLNMSKVLQGAVALKARGCSSIDISDGARARMRMSPVVVSHLIQQTAGIEVMMHFCCRDRNLLAIQADLLGCHALGLRNILAITGDPTNIGDYPTATSVFDMDSIGLVRVLRRLNEGLDLAGNSIGEPTAFLIAVAFNPLAPDAAAERDRLRRKAEAGADLAYTQPIYEADVALEAAEFARGLGLPMMLGLVPLRSARQAEFFHNEVPGMQIPDPVRRHIATLSDEDALQYGIDLARETLVQCRSAIAGAYLMPPAGRWKVAAAVMEALK